MMRLFTVQGKNTSDNRDVIAHFSHFDVTVFIVLDGATNCPSGGDFSRALASEIQKKFEVLPQFDLRDKSVKALLIRLLKETQMSLQKTYILDFASMLLVVRHQEDLFVAHSGDCCLGFIQKNNQISWVTPLHTVANIENKMMDEIVSDPLRHILTRSFMAKKMIIPEFGYFQVPEHASIIMATDGFWGVSKDIQRELLASPKEIDVNDDASYIISL